MVKILLLLAFSAHVFDLTSSTRNYREEAYQWQRWPRQRSIVRCSQNEIRVRCPEAVCVPKTCDDVGFEVSCFDLGPNGSCPTRPGCICKKGFVRNHRGFCIPIQFCRAPLKCEKRNEVCDPCPSSCPPRTCGINDASISCAPALPIGHPHCPPPACRCKNGFYRNHLGNCVPWKKCPKCKRPNEVYDPCPATCPQQTCGVDDALILCQVSPQLGSPKCKPGCRCIDGFVKNEANICIPKDECPTACYGDPNAVSGCGVYCNQRCRDVGKEPGACILPCYPDSCDCRKGYYLDENIGKCVLPEQCTPQCPFNEVYSNCIQGDCRPQNCSQLGFSVSCPRIDPKFCKTGCLCKEGYFRNDEGVCIPESECPPQCPENEWYSECIQGNCNPEYCTQVGLPKACPSIDSNYCKKGCLCNQGYARNDEGFCIPSSECPLQCPENEWYSECIQGNCNPEYCTQVGLPIACPAIDSNSCKKGCLCQEGYARNDEGFCIPSSECPLQCPENEWYSECIQGNCNPEYCTQVGLPIACPAIDSNSCKKGCLCQEGYARNDEGFCIPSSECPLQCPENEWYSECTQGNCNPEYCTQVGLPIACPAIDSNSCKKGCLCQEGYARNDVGFCIPSSECQTRQIRPPNLPIACPAIDSNSCKKGCLCQEGYARNDEGFCIPSNECPLQCPENERYSECTQSNCSPENCTQIGFPLACPGIDPSYCKKGCLCQEGYARNDEGFCIPSSECPLQCPENEWYSECTQGNCNPEYCTQVGLPIACPAIDSNSCKKGCLCQEGYARNDEGFCIPSNECPLQCPENERYSECTQSNCSPENCTQIGFPLACPGIDPSYCKKGCLCNQGYARNDEGYCIPSNECPSCGGDRNAVAGCGGNCNRHCSDIGKEPGACSLICELNGCNCKEGFYYDDSSRKCVKPERCSPTCPLNEVYSDCINGGCQARNCSQYGKPVPCIKMNPKHCKTGCVCKDTYLRASNGQCVPEEDCSGRCTGPHEYYSCGGACDNVCETLSEQSQNNCPIVNIKCNEMCYCDEGYARAKNNTCIAISSCDDDTRQCPLNERNENCPGSTCEPQYCNELGFSSSCLPQPEDGSCPTKPGCVCVDGYLRDENGKCIPKNQCPSCGDDANARSGCGVNCGKRCRDLIKTGPCVRICYVNACDCKDGFYYDSNQNKCVLAGQCTDICDKNEVFEDCSNPTCRAKNCTQVGLPLDCNETCVKECVCQNGYVRDGNGTCIPIKQCPSCGGDPNAQSGCGTNCGRRCPNNYINPKLCPRIACVPGLNKCDCKDGFYYDINTQSCVELEDCSPYCDDSNNEVYDPCVNGGCGWRNCSQVGSPMLCIDPVKCNKGCTCKDEYYRLDNGTCVSEEMCS